MPMKPENSKMDSPSIAEINRTIRNIRDALERYETFLVIGHENPDEDCIASMVAMALLVAKLNKKVQIDLCTTFQDQFRYLLNICRFNSIVVHEGSDKPDLHVDAILVMDTPKPEMIGSYPFYREAISAPNPLKIEIDHHLEGDSSYSGDPGYRLVLASSSSCELVATLAFKLNADKDFMKRAGASDLFERNVILSLLTGMIADSHMGTYLKTRRERKFYELISGALEEMLRRKTRSGSGNFSSKEELFGAIDSLSSSEESCFKLLSSCVKREGRIHHAILDESKSRETFALYGNDVLVSVSKALTDRLAEESGCLGLVAYFDDPIVSNFVQFRLRRSQSYSSLDLRDILQKLSIAIGGGHPGAIGFRFDRSEIPDMAAFSARLIARIGELVKEAG